MQIEAVPCLSGCHVQPFPSPIGMQEIRPDNSFPFPVYRSFMHRLNASYLLSIHYTSSVTNFQNYEKPTEVFLGLPELHKYSLAKQQINKLTFQQVHVKTWDGLLRKSLKEDRSMLFRNAAYRNKLRTLYDPVQIIEVELSDTVVQVERVYPNIIDLFSEIGSILKVLVFLCIATGIMHNKVLLDKYLLNSIFSKEDKSDLTEQGDFVIYSYWNILFLKYCCPSKQNKRKARYDRHC